MTGETVEPVSLAIQVMETWVPELDQAVRRATKLSELEEIRNALRPFVADVLRIQDAAAERCDDMLKRRD